jgi:hypothetical protein
LVTHSDEHLFDQLFLDSTLRQKMLYIIYPMIFVLFLIVAGLGWYCFVTRMLHGDWIASPQRIFGDTRQHGNRGRVRIEFRKKGEKES